MTVSYFVRYEIEAGDDFVRHYKEKHVPILARWPGMRRVLQSPQRMEARRDFESLPAFEGRVFHQAMQQEEAWRKP